MTVLTAKRYCVIVILQSILLIFDISVNSFVSFARQYPVDLLILYVVQDFCHIIALAILLLSFFSTYVFQVGLLELLYTRFRFTLILSVFYIILSIGLHVWHVTIVWHDPFAYYWSKGFHALNTIHKIVAVLYYYFYKRAALKIGDPRFHEGSIWMQKQLSFS